MAFDAFRSPVCSGRLFIALGRWPICAVFDYAAASAGAQIVPFEQVPEFEAWIQEADKSKMDSIDFVQAMRAAGSATFAQSRSFNKYVLARIDARIAKLDVEAKEREVRIAKLDAELLKQTKVVLAAMKTLEAQGRLGPDAVADLNKMANNDLEEVRVLVRREFGKYLKPERRTTRHENDTFRLFKEQIV